MRGDQSSTRKTPRGREPRPFWTFGTVWFTTNAIGWILAPKTWWESTTSTEAPYTPGRQTAFSFLPATHHYGPRLLAPECAAWAINTATAFLDSFYTRMGQTPNHEHLRHRIEVQQT
jgi:hypothetical protein